MTTRSKLAVGAALVALGLAWAAYGLLRPARHRVHVRNTDAIELAVQIDTTDGCCHWQRTLAAGASGDFTIASDRDLGLRIAITAAGAPPVTTEAGYFSGFVGPDEARHGTCVEVTREGAGRPAPCDR
jgi:hypothetical protein